MWRNRSSHRSTHKQFLVTNQQFPQAMSWTPHVKHFYGRKASAILQKYFYPKGYLKTNKQTKTLHKVLKGFIAGLSYGYCPEHPEEPAPILAGLLGCATSSGELVTFLRPQDWVFFPHWNAAVTSEGSSSWSHLLREGPKKTDPSVLLPPSLHCNISPTATDMWIYNEYKAAV